jgi:hypothetical protein
MSISPALLHEIITTVEAEHSGTLGELRAKFPGILFTECDAEDIPARLKPVWETRRHLYFLYTHLGGHCLEFTDDFTAATGIVLAARTEEKD